MELDRICDYCNAPVPEGENHAGEYDNVVCLNCSEDLIYFEGDDYGDPSINCR